MNSEDEFEKIISDNGLNDWFKDSPPTALTLGDLYEGISILSSAQVDLHHYLKDVMECLRINNQAGEEVRPVPRLKPIQATLLVQMFEDCAKFSEEFDVE